LAIWLGALALGAACGQARAVDFHVATAQDLQNALTSAAGNGANNNIWLTNGYYSGNFDYNCLANTSLAVLTEAGVTNTQVVIDGGGNGGGLNINCSGSSGDVTVSNITFVRNCGSYNTVGALRIAAPSGGTNVVDGCRFISLTNSLGIGLQIASGLNTIIRNCTVLGKTNGSAYDGDGINISGVTGTTLIYNSTSAGNYVGNGADITASAVLTVTNNNFQSNYYDGLSFNPSTGIKVAQVLVTNNVFSGNGLSGNYYGAYVNNFGTLTNSGNIFTGNKGGGLYVNNGNTADLAGNTFYANGYYNGYYGGAAFGSLGNVLVTANTFSMNSNGYGGGGVYFYSITTNLVTGNTFNGNTVYSASGGGAACFLGGSSSSTVTVSNNTFSGNNAYPYGPGGAVSFSSSGTVNLIGNTFTGNSSSGNYGGGAAYFTGGTNTISVNTFKQNSSAYGGGAIYATAPSINISDNLVVNNSQSGASQTGGGIFVNASSLLYLVNNTIFGNTSGGGGGGASFQVSGSVELLNVFNNIIWGNSASGSGADVYLTGTGQKKLFMYNDANGMSGVWDNALPLLNVNPVFFDPVNGDYHLQTTSLCLNYGTNGTFLALTDLDGNSRTNSAGQVDLGCYEFNNTAAHPADLDANFVITAAEYSAYAAAWKAGQSWTKAPNPIPANYVTRAGYLMTNGGTYHNDGSARPTNWKPGP
jgi:predicted outer membrane repeat protein